MQRRTNGGTFGAWAYEQACTCAAILISRLGSSPGTYGCTSVFISNIVYRTSRYGTLGLVVFSFTGCSLEPCGPGSKSTEYFDLWATK